MKLWPLLILLVIGLCGCSGGSSRDGTEATARAFFDAEFQKWMAGQETQVSTMKSRIGNLKNPISYDIRSVVHDQPDMLAIAEDYNQHGEPSDNDG